MNLKRISSFFDFLLLGALLMLSLEILVRRFIWHQVPTQLSSKWVLTLLALNLGYCFFYFKIYIKKSPTS